MNASRFNAVYNELMIAPLVRGGFVQRRSNVYLVAGDAVLALLRFQNGPEALLQRTHVIVCVRHTFLRELQDLTVPDVFVSDINDYPIKERLSTMSCQANGWRYRPINLGVRSDDYDTIDHGSLKDSNAAQAVLAPIASRVAVAGRALLARLTAAEALRQLREHGENAWCERVWIDDYERHLRI